MSVEAIGLVGSVLGIWSFADGLLPAYNEDASTYDIRAGEDGTKDSDEKVLNNAGGGIDLIKVYNNVPELIGSGGSGNVDQGEIVTFTTEQTNTQQAITTEFYATNDALCIAWITATMAKGEQWGWTGDWGYTCTYVPGDLNCRFGQYFSSEDMLREFVSGAHTDQACGNTVCLYMAPAKTPATVFRAEILPGGEITDFSGLGGLNWFPSGDELQNSQNDSHVSPRCTWIDADHSNGLKAGVIAISWPDFYGTIEGDPMEKCGTSLRAWDAPGGKQLLSPDGIVARTVGPRRSQRSDDRLIVSHFNTHSAIEVCESETSYGPDFVSMAEGLYCNMETHDVLPLCSNGVFKDCFHMNGTARNAMVSASGFKKAMKHSKVVEWTPKE